MRRSLMTGEVIGQDIDEVEQKAARQTGGEQSHADLRQRGVEIGAAAEINERLGKLARSGVQKVMLQWIELDDINGLEALAKAVFWCSYRLYEKSGS